MSTTPDPWPAGIHVPAGHTLSPREGGWDDESFDVFIHSLTAKASPNLKDELRPILEYLASDIKPAVRRRAMLHSIRSATRTS